MKCYFCHGIKGALAEVKKYKWAHIQCVNWIPAIYFETNTEIKGTVKSGIYTCCICKKKSGASL